jgi:hypothetical protein
MYWTLLHTNKTHYVLDTTTHKQNTLCTGHYYTKPNTNNVNKTWSFLQTTGGKDEPNIVFMRNS